MTDYVYLGKDDHTYITRVEGPSLTRAVFSPRQSKLYLNTNGPLEICSHSFFTKIADDPYQVIQHMQALKLPPAYGGWRPFKAEKSVLAVTASSISEQLKGSKNMPALKKHPAILGGLGYILPKNGIPFRTFAVLQDVFDVRAYVRPAAPDDSSLLCNALQLDSPLAIPSVDNISIKCFLGWFALPPCFLYDYQAAAIAQCLKTMKNDDAKTVAVWRTTRLFVDFIYKTMRAGLGDAPFDYVKFFEHEKDRQSFAKYIKQIDNCA